MADRERVGRFLRTLLGLLTVAWLAVAVVVPPDPYSFMLWLVPAWVLALFAAVAMELAHGYWHLRNSPLYRPGVEASTATVVFVGVTLALKALLTLLADLVFGTAAVGHREGAVAGVLALALSYVLVFVVGVLGRALNGTGEGADARRRDDV